MFKKLLLASVCAAGTLAFANQASAVPFGPASITVGGTTFTNFDVVLTNFGALATPVTASSIAVTANPTGDGIQISSGFTAFGLPAFTDAAVSFSAFNPNGITGANLNISAGVFFGLGIASVTETIANAITNQNLISLAAACSLTSCTPADTTDPDAGFKSFGGSYTSLRIQKDINVTSLGGFSQISIVNEGFQTTRVPEPMSLALLGTALVGAGVVRRRSRKA